MRPILIRFQDYGTKLFPFDNRFNKTLEENYKKSRTRLFQKISEIKRGAIKRGWGTCGTF